MPHSNRPISVNRKSAWIAGLCAALLAGLALASRVDGQEKPAKPASADKSYDDSGDDDPIPKTTIDPAAARKACVDCHAKTEPGLVAAWASSRHAKKDVSCADCHGLDHSTIFGALGKVSAKTCGGCHEKDAAEFATSGHAHAGETMAADPRYVAAGAVERAACNACHAIGEKDALDGAPGRCDGCHVGHDFRAAQAAEPATCARCHSGPDHPQAEAYAVSKHGILYAATHDPTRAPTCASCHMPDGAHGRDLGIGLGSALQGRRPDKDPAPPYRMEAIDGKTLRAAHDLAIGRCANCHARRVAADALAQADEVKRDVDRQLAVAARAILGARAAEGAPAPALGPDLVPGRASDLERAFFEAWKTSATTAWKGAYHLAPSLVFNDGLQPLGLALAGVAADARAREKAAIAASADAPRKGSR